MLVRIFDLMRKIAFPLVAILLCLQAFPQKKRIITPRTHAGLRFTENKGQWEEQVNYMVRMNGGNIYLEKDKLTYFLFDNEKFRSFHMGGIGGARERGRF